MKLSLLALLEDTFEICMKTLNIPKGGGGTLKTNLMSYQDLRLGNEKRDKKGNE